MSWWGKAIGGTFGYMLGGPLGAIVGAALGHNFDTKIKNLGESGDSYSTHERTQMAFFTATFSVMGNLAKSDGQVSEDEIRLAESVMGQMQLNAEQRRFAINLFNQGKNPDFHLHEVLAQFKRECRFRHALMRIFLEIQIQAALADGEIHDNEQRILIYVCEQLGFSRFEFERLLAMISATYGAGQQWGRGPATPAPADISAAYAVLNIPSSATDAEVKKAYRRLMNQHHPDKLVAKGLPEEMMKIAAEKTHEIRSAYDQIRAVRGM